MSVIASIKTSVSVSHAAHAAPSPMVTLQAVGQTWLELTQTWLHNQITHLPPHICSHVLCENTANLQAFPHPSVRSFDRTPRMLQVWDRLLRKSRLRRHLGHAARVARELRPHLVHSHFGPTGWELLDVVRATGARHVVTFYGLDVNFLPQHGWRDRYHELFRCIDLVLCEGPHMARCIAALGCPETKVRVHHLGVRVDDIRFRPRSWRLGERFRVLMAASFREKKGLPYAVRALGLLKGSIDLEATIIGGASDSAQSRQEERAILQAIDECGLRDRVRLLGFQPASVLMEEASRHHLFLSPSVTASNGDTEGGAPITIIEMAASGIPIVSTTHCDIPEVIDDGVSGLLAPERDVEALAARIEELVAHPGNWGRMLTAGRRRIEEQFDARTQGRALGTWYQALVDGKDHS